MRAVVDTNVLVYDTFEDSIYHRDARSILDGLDEWVIPLIVIYEYVWFLKGLNVSLEDATLKVREYLLSSKNKLIVEEIDDLVKALDMLLLEKLSLSRFNDKIVLSIASRIGAVATFDDKLRKQAAKKGIAVLP